MNSSIQVLLVAIVCMLAGVTIGTWLRGKLPEHHLSDDAASVIKSGVGLLSTLSALILGLLISTAKVSYDSTATQINQIAADMIVADQLLSQFGEAGTEARKDLRAQAATLADAIWATSRLDAGRSFSASGAWMKLSAALQQLPNATEDQRVLRKEIGDVISRSAQARIRIFADAGGALPIPFVALLIAWLTVIFASYSLLGAMNSTVRVFVFLFALSAAGALFLISELNTPFSGLLQIPKSHIARALSEGVS